VPKQVAIRAHHERKRNSPLIDGFHITQRGVPPVIRGDSILNVRAVMLDKLFDFFRRFVADPHHHNAIFLETPLEVVEVGDGGAAGQTRSVPNLHHINVRARLYFHRLALDPFAHIQGRGGFTDQARQAAVGREPGHQNHEREYMLNSLNHIQ
jgi:hypothetical protein